MKARAELRKEREIARLTKKLAGLQERDRRRQAQKEAETERLRKKLSEIQTRQRNPMDTMTKWYVGLGAFAAAAVGLGLYEHYKAPAATGPVYSGGGQLSIVLSPGAMDQVALSLTGDNQVSVSGPSGATSVTLVSADPTTVAIAGTNATAKKIGSTTLTGTYVDSSGSSQTSSIPVVVSA